MASNNPHKGHRERLRSQIKARGLDGLPEHNVLEYLLFPLIPQRDTNELAHRLIGEFGSFSGVLDAGYEQLRTVQGMTDTLTMSFGSIPFFSAYQVLTIAPNICCGLLQLERFSSMSG